MSLFSFGTKEEVVLILDIGSSSIGGALVKMRKKDTPEIIELVREEIAFQEDLNYKRFLDDTIKTVQKVVGKMVSNKKNRPDHIHCIFSSPWFIAQNRTFTYKKQEPFTVTKKLIDHIMAEEIEEFKNTAKDSIPGIKSSKTNVRAIEVKITDFYLNGYEVNSPYNKKTKELKVSFFASVCSEKVYDMFNDAISGAAHNDLVSYHSFPLVAFSALRDISATPDNFMLADINGEITDIMTVRNGSIIETTSFPLGRNFAKRWLMKKFGTSKDITASKLKLYLEDKLDEKTKLEVEAVVGYLEMEWNKSLKEALKLSSYEYLLPQNLFVISDDTYIPLFSRFLSSPELASFNRSNKPFRVTSLKAPLLGQVPVKKGMVYRDTFLLLETIFIDKLFRVK